jgi:hypothetical protein
MSGLEAKLRAFMKENGASVSEVMVALAKIVEAPVKGNMPEVIKRPCFTKPAGLRKYVDTLKLIGLVRMRELEPVMKFLRGEVRIPKYPAGHRMEKSAKEFFYAVAEVEDLGLIAKYIEAAAFDRKNEEHDLGEELDRGLFKASRALIHESADPHRITEIHMFACNSGYEWEIGLNGRFIRCEKWHEAKYVPTPENRKLYESLLAECVGER